MAKIRQMKMQAFQSEQYRSQKEVMRYYQVQTETELSKGIN
jgi:hypothetical protein